MNKRKLCRYVLTFLFLLQVSQVVFAQQQIKGKVSDQVTGSPLQGVSVQVKSTPKAVVTNKDGDFSLTVNDTNVVLVFSYVGYQTIEQKVTGGQSMDIGLSPASKELEDVVVVGYGVVKRRDLTGAVSSVKAADIVRTPASNAMEAIQGRVPGADITRSTGKPGAGINVQLRGNRSISGNGYPLYIVDGVQITSGNINDVNPNDIESIDVLKDASSTAIYGSAGANGVVIVTTKKGKEGKPKVSYSGYYGINGLAAFPKGRTGDAYIQLRREAFRTSGAWASPADDGKIFTQQELDAIAKGEYVDWTDELMRNGIQQSHTLSVSGGNDKIKTFLSAGYFNETGRLVNDVFRRYSIRFNIEYKLNSWIKTGIQSQLTMNNTDQRPDQLLKSTGVSPLGVAYDSAGNINLRPVVGDKSRISPLADNRGKSVYTDNTYGNNELINPYIELTPLKGLSFRSNFGANLSSSRRGIYRDSTSFYHLDRSEKFSDISVTNSTSKVLTWDNILTYTREFGDHSFTITGIATLVHNIGDVYLTTANGAGLTGWQQYHNISAADAATIVNTSTYKQIDSRGYAGRINYSYKGKYLLTVTSRTDGDSRLSVQKRWSSFPSVAAAWNVSSEKFMSGITPVLNSLKIRASYGISGNSGTGDEAYPTQNVIIRNNSFAFGGLAAPSYLFNTLVANPDLGWERTATTNIGLDMSFMHSRITASADAYYARTYDMLIRRRLPVYTGVGSAGTPAQIFQNIGETVNKGIELVVNAQTIKNDNFQWNTVVTLTANKEKIISLIDDKDLIPSTDAELGSYLVGRPLHSIYSYRKLGIWQTKEAAEAASYNYGGVAFKPGDIKLQDLDGNHTIDAKDRTYLGSTNPKFILGLQNNFNYRNFDLGIYLIMRWGQTINAEMLGRYNPDGSGNGLAFMDYWTPEHPTNDFPRPSTNTLSNYPGYLSLNYVDGSFIKIKNVSLGYSLPKRISGKLLVDNVRFYATASNVFTITKSHLLKNYDPERGGSADDPLNRQIVFGVNVGF